MELTPGRIAAGRAALRWMVEEGRKQGMPIQFIYAHRQSHGGKPGDPGEGLWRALVLEYAVPVLGLKTEPARTWEGVGKAPDGLPIPKEWDENGVGSYR